MKQNSDTSRGGPLWDKAVQVVPYGTILRHLPMSGKRGSSSPAFGRGPKFSEVLRSDLRNFNRKTADGKHVVSDDRASQIKLDVKKLLGIPVNYEIHLFTGDDGSALIVERDKLLPGVVNRSSGRTVIRGFIRCMGHGGLLEQIPFSYDLTHRRMNCDGNDVAVGGVSSLLHAISIEATHGASLGEVLRRAHVRAHKPLLRGSFGDRLVVLTSAGDCLFGFIGVRWKMMPILISATSLTGTDLGVLLEGMTCDGALVTIFMPTADALERNVQASVNGCELTTEEFSLNGESACAPQRVGITN